jgi:hypothetical protein
LLKNSTNDVKLHTHTHQGILQRFFFFSSAGNKSRQATFSCERNQTSSPNYFLNFIGTFVPYQVPL